MAKAITHKITTTDKLTLKGKLNVDGTTITITEEKVEIEKKLIDFVQKFADKYVEISITEKSEEDIEE